ncbi:MAG TPA: nicotinate (nicotinamide) nucleotide adenylyltransferase [Nitrospirae bacterium]|nr:putative nicotinate-nucleotide adenylyltransferase [bacterium BMS3Abin06]HDH11085.1 nicotinate (nicotinamide) nucleotide adenylyltransferase [Nitrospirota bacterium]HDZ02294.1 nicotinate (nicotinamide) nucleotide adenylyltransferase [Nitrospirota bacterium]
MKIGAYGGAFNPIHYGHLRTAEEVFEILSLDKILFITAGKTPFDKPDLEKTAHRYEMVKKAVKGNHHFEASDIEIKKRGRSYTVETIRKLRDKYRESELFFILGIDAFLDLPNWNQPDKLINLANIVIISRPGYRYADLSSSPYLKNVSVKTLKELDKGIKNDFSFDISKTQKGFLCKVTGLNISASHIRDLIMSGRNIKYLLPDSVKSYIISNKLYVRRDSFFRQKDKK